MQELLEKYKQQIKADLEINRINVGEVARSLPAKRHFWSSKLIDHKIKINELERSKVKILKEVSQKLNKAAPVAIGVHNLNKAAEQSDEIQSINEQIAEHKLFVEFLEVVQKNFFSASYDVSNIINLQKLEQL